jgi:hypothetical protein
MSEQDLMNTVMSKDPDFPLPRKVVKRVKSTESRRKRDDWKPLNPNFCDHIIPESGKKCGRFLNEWNTLFYRQYQMCEDCYNKYIKEKVDEIKTST